MSSAPPFSTNECQDLAVGATHRLYILTSAINKPLLAGLPIGDVLAHAKYFLSSPFITK